MFLRTIFVSNSANINQFYDMFETSMWRKFDLTHTYGLMEQITFLQIKMKLQFCTETNSYFSHLVGERMWIAEISAILDLSTRIIGQGKRHEIWRENIW